jgi:hypothetical protein
MCNPLPTTSYRTGTVSMRHPPRNNNGTTRSEEFLIIFRQNWLSRLRLPCCATWPIPGTRRRNSEGESGQAPIRIDRNRLRKKTLCEACCFARPRVAGGTLANKGLRRRPEPVQSASLHGFDHRPQFANHLSSCEIVGQHRHDEHHRDQECTLSRSPSVVG